MFTYFPTLFYKKMAYTTYLFFFHLIYIKNLSGTSLAVQWLRLRASNSGHTGLIPGRGTKIPHAVGHGQKKKT